MGQKGILTGSAQHLMNQEMLIKYLQELQGSIHYIDGPPGMASTMRKMFAPMIVYVENA